MRRFVILVLLLAAAPAPFAQDAREASEMRARIYMTAQQGHTMTPEEVTAAQAKLAEEPGDTETIYKLLGFYKANMKPQLVEPKAELLLWMIANRPEDPILETPYGDVEMPLEAKTWERGRAAWETQIAKQPKNTAVLSNAARFAMRKDRDMVTDLLNRAREIEPTNPTWPLRLAGVYEYRTLFGNRLEDHQAAYKAWQDVYALTPEDERLLMLPKLAMTALKATEYDEAKQWADKAMAAVEVLKPRNLHGEAINAAHTVYGRLALRAGDVEGAAKHLLASADMPGSMRLNNFGPNLRLAQMLILEGQQETVIRYLEAVGDFWKPAQEQIAEWIHIIREGDTPDFGQNMRL